MKKAKKKKKQVMYPLPKEGWLVEKFIPQAPYLPSSQKKSGGSKQRGSQK